MNTQSNTKQTKTRCAVYLRRSQDREDRQQLTIEKQDGAVAQIIQENNFLPKYYPPEERSAKKPGRPLFGEMLRDIEEGSVRHIAVWHLSRLSRNAFDAGQIVQLMDDGKLLSIFTPTRSYRNTPEDKAFLSIELAFAKKNNDDLSKQVSESFKQKVARGEYPGPAPTGYINALTAPGKRNIVPDPTSGPKVTKLFREAATGAYTLDGIWKMASDIDLRTRKGHKLSKQSVSELLQRRLYTGVFRYGGVMNGTREHTSH